MQWFNEIPQKDQRLCLHNLPGHNSFGTLNPNRSRVILHARKMQKANSIRKNIDLEIPAKVLRDVCESSIRALVMAGTFKEARGAYEKFYSLDFRKYGVDIPPRLDDLCNDKNTMLYAQQSLQQIEKGKPDLKLIEGNAE